MSLTNQYLQKARAILHTAGQHTEAIPQVAQRFGQAILAGRMVHPFGSGHSRIMVKEMWPPLRLVCRFQPHCGVIAFVS